MSKKPKKRDEQKRLEAKMGRKTRNSEFTPKLPPRTELFCEGTKTEPHYLQEIINLINERYGAYAMGARIKMRDRFKITPTRGRSATNLLEYAVNQVASGTEEV